MRDDEALASRIESVLFVAGGPVPIGYLARALAVPQSQISTALESLRARLCHGIRAQILDGQVQLVTAPENADAVRQFVGFARPAPLSRAALEVLALVAYQQPVTRSEIESARGVQSDRALHTLLSRGLIEETGRRAAPGRPHEYGTTFAFLEYFGLTSLEDLPDISSLGEENAGPLEMGLRRTKPVPG